MFLAFMFGKWQQYVLEGGSLLTSLLILEAKSFFFYFPQVSLKTEEILFKNMTIMCDTHRQRTVLAWGGVVKSVFFLLFFRYSSRTIGDRIGEGKASGNLGNTLKVLGRFDEAVVCCQRHLDISQEQGDKVIKMFCSKKINSFEMAAASSLRVCTACVFFFFLYCPVFFFF